MTSNRDMQAGPVVTDSPSSVHRAVHKTAMHSTFDQHAINEWVQRDYARQEEGQPDTLAYLTESLRFLMAITNRQQQFAELCRSQQADVDGMRSGLAATIETLKAFKMDTTALEGQCRLAQNQSVQLNAIANIHGQFSENPNLLALFDDLQVRIEAVIRPHGQVAGVRRLN